MKVGDYVRTPKGITKIIDIRDEIIRNSANGNEVVIETNTYITDNGFSVSNDYKSSPNIIDLIEVGDYVNGGIVKEITKHYIRMNGTKELLFQFIDKDKPDEVKSIVTKEQFENMEYKVEV